MALELLPESNGPKVEVLGGSVVGSPHAGFDHQDIEAELIVLLKRMVRRAGYWFYHEVNLVRGDDLFIPDIVVLGRSDAVLLGEIMSPQKRRKDLIDRPREYAEAGVPWYLVDGAYKPVVAAAAGTAFTMTEPFEFSIDPGELLDDEVGQN